jgi:hypothetical protein
MTPQEIRQAGVAALLRELGPVGMARFLLQFDRGSGDYAKDRHAWVDHLTVDDVAQMIENRRRRGE